MVIIGQLVESRTAGIEERVHVDSHGGQESSREGHVCYRAHVTGRLEFVVVQLPGFDEFLHIILEVIIHGLRQLHRLEYLVHLLGRHNPDPCHEEILVRWLLGQEFKLCAVGVAMQAGLAVAALLLAGHPWHVLARSAVRIVGTIEHGNEVFLCRFEVIASVFGQCEAFLSGASRLGDGHGHPLGSVLLCSHHGVGPQLEV